MSTSTWKRDPPPERPRWLGIIFLITAAAALGGCDVEEQIRVAPDGTGSYEARVTLAEDVPGVMGRLKQQADRRGFAIVEEDEYDRVLVVGRRFEDISELDADSARYRFEVDRRDLLHRSYRLTVELREDLLPSGFDRRLLVHMPAPVRWSSSGEIAGETVDWECSRGGTLIVEAEGASLSPASGCAMAVGGLGLGAAFLVGVHIRRSSSR